jgi:type I restriction enzyme R subunit
MCPAVHPHSNGRLHYVWDLEQGNPVLITEYPTPTSLGHC